MERKTRSKSFAEEGLTVADRLGTAWSRRKVLRTVGNLDGLVLADVGSGFDARLAVSLVNQCRTVHVFDVSLSETLGAYENVVSHQGDVFKKMQQVEDESLDVILCISVLEHLVDDVAALELFWSKLKWGGQLIVNVPSWRGKRVLEFAAFRLEVSPASEMDDHKRYYNPTDLWPRLVGCGFPPHSVRCRRYKLGLNTFAHCRKERVIV